MDATLVHEFEMHQIALNRELWAEAIGLEVDAGSVHRNSQALASIAERLADLCEGLWRSFAVETWAEARIRRRDERIVSELDDHARVPELASSAGVLTWRNWRVFERETAAADTLTQAYAEMISRSSNLSDLLQARLHQLRGDHAVHGLSPHSVYCERERISAGQLRTVLEQGGYAARSQFAQRLRVVSQQVFGRDPGAAELHALTLNRMYEPLAGLFAGPRWTPSAVVAQVQRAGLSLANVPLDLTDRPRKTPGAFCFPIAIPQDVRVSVRVASAHHLVDMLYHELGHAAHFTTIDRRLPYIDRYWMHSGLHETFSTLIESLLADPIWLSEELGLAPAAVEALAEFGALKRVWTLTESAAAALAALDGWEERLDWPRIDSRYVYYARTFTGVDIPPGAARLHPFVSQVSLYPAGYVLAELRVAAWRRALTRQVGPAWWRSKEACESIAALMRRGAQAEFIMDTPEQLVHDGFDPAVGPQETLSP
jgi:hypothetical protein